MDIGKINNTINFDKQNEQNHTAANNKIQNHCLQNINISTAKLPNAPEYWQAQKGISGRNINFCGNKFSDKQSGNFYYYKWLFKNRKNNDEYFEIHKENMKKLTPYGKYALEVYDWMAVNPETNGNKNGLTKKEFDRKLQIASRIIDIKPEIYASREYYESLNIIANKLAKDDLKYPDRTFFNAKLEIVEAVLSEKGSLEEKFWWLENCVVNNIQNCNSFNIEDYKRKTVENFKAFSKSGNGLQALQAYLNDFSAKGGPDIIQGSLSNTSAQSKEGLKYTVIRANRHYVPDEHLNENLGKILDKIKNNPSLAKHYDNHIKEAGFELRRLVGFYIDQAFNSAQLFEELERAEKDSFRIEVVDYLSKNRDTSYLFRSVDEYTQFIDGINKDNFQNFKDLFEKDKLILRNAVNIAVYCKDKNGSFKLYPEQKESLNKYLKKDGAMENYSRLLPALSMEYVKENSAGEPYFDKKGFSQMADILLDYREFNDIELILPIKNLINLLKGENFGLSSLSFKQTFKIYQSLSNIQENLKKDTIYDNRFNFIDKALSDIEYKMNTSEFSLPVEESSIQDFATKIVASKKDGFSEFEKAITDSIPLLKSFDDGVPLKYSRKEFLSDLSKICDSKDKIKTLSSKIGIQPLTEGDGQGNITGYNGIIRLDDLNKDEPFEAEIYNLAHKFLYENKVNTGNKELDDNLNTIIKAFPEFINTIGKKQHSTHEYTLDIHTLLVLANSINNPDYKNLAPANKTVLKTAALFHDILKAENEADENHQILSAFYARGIVKKFMKNPEMLERLSEFIKNHHWLRDYDPSKKYSIKSTAFKFRRAGDFDAAKIMAQADLMSVSDEFYNTYKDALKKDRITKIEESIEEFNSNGCAVFSDYIVAPDKLKGLTQKYKGVDYKVIDFHKISNNEDLSKYGFVPKRFKKDVRFLVHMVPGDKIRSSLDLVKRLSSSINEGCLSVSLIDTNHARTYCDRKYGVILSSINDNVVNINSTNQGSGGKKGSNEAIDFCFYNTEKRENFKKNVLLNLGIEKVSDKEYAAFYRDVLSQKTSLAGIMDDKEYFLSGKKFTGRDLKDAITKFQNSLIDETKKEHNELLCYIPKINAVVAKENSLSKVPDEILDFANENNLPIVLI